PAAPAPHAAAAVHPLALLASSSLLAKASASFVQPVSAITKTGLITGLLPGVIITKFPGIRIPPRPLPPPPPPSQRVRAVEVKELFLQGTNTNLKSGDRLLLVGTNNDNVIQA